MKRTLFLLVFLLASTVLAADDFYALRKRMVEKQIVARGIKDEKVLDALLEVERHKFVPKNLQYFAYTDHPLPIGYGQTISQPYIVALMTELLDLKPDEKLLEIGTGSGYQAAVLSLLCKQVYTIEILEPLAENSAKLLSDLGYTNVAVKCGDGFLGWEEYAPFDAIIVTCAPEEIPPKLVEQLKEGGRIVIPVGDKFQQLQLVVKKKRGKIKVKDITPVRFVPMIKGQ